MIDRITADLLAEAKSRAELCGVDTREAMRDTGRIILRLVDALEDAEQRSEEAWKAAEDHVLDADAVHVRLSAELREVNQERDQYAAVLEEVRAEVTRTPPSGFGYYLPSGNGLRTILATAPADALREVKAEAWQEGAYRVYNSINADEAEWWWSDWANENPYRAREEQDR